MDNTLDYKQLREILHPYTLLYAEDNAGLSSQAVRLFKKFFTTVYCAHDGIEALDLFKEHHPSIVITDIRMPKLNGLELSEKIRGIDSEVKIIVTTAHDEKEYLYKAIRLGIFEFLTKPLKIEILFQTLLRCANELNAELHRKLFLSNMHAIFDYQNSLVILLHHRTVLMANQHCLDFFMCSSIGELKQKFVNFGDLLLEHNTFLYNHDGIEWFDSLSSYPGKLFNVKIASKKLLPTHFILTYQAIPEKDGYSILSLNDVSELNLLKLYDSDSFERDLLAKDEQVVRHMIELAHRSGDKVHLNNIYKGLSITNNGMIEAIDKNHLILHAPQVQLKAMQLEKECYISSELFVSPIRCQGIAKIDYEMQNITFTKYQMVQTSPSQRKVIRLIPADDIRITVFFKERRLSSLNSILDVSINAMRLEFESLPNEFELKSEVRLDMVISSNARPIIINTVATIYYVSEISHCLEVVVTYELHGTAQKTMIDYVAKRQLGLIREFKGLQI